MRKGWTLALCGGVALLGLTVWASEKAPTEFANAMRVSAAAQAALEGHLPLELPLGDVSEPAAQPAAPPSGEPGDSDEPSIQSASS